MNDYKKTDLVPVFTVKIGPIQNHEIVIHLVDGKIYQVVKSLGLDSFFIRDLKTNVIFPVKFNQIRRKIPMDKIMLDEFAL